MSILNIDLKELEQEFIRYARKETESCAFEFEELDQKIRTLPTKTTYSIIHRGFESACRNNNLDFLRVLLSTSFYKNQINDDVILYGLHSAIENRHTGVLSYLLVDSPVAFKHQTPDLKIHGHINPKDEPKNLLMAAFNYGLFYSGHAETLEFLINQAEQQLLLLQQKPIDIFDEDMFRGFRLAWDSGNPVALALLVEKYHITGEEPHVKEHLGQTKDFDFTNRAHIFSLMQANFEKQLLETTLLTPDTNTDLISSSTKAKIKI